MGRLEPPPELLTTIAVPRGPVTDTQVLSRRLTLATATSLTGLFTLAMTLWLVPAPRATAELVSLLHGMVLIKGLIALAAGALVFWRLGRPIARPLATGYIGALCLSSAGLGWLWGLHLMLLGAGLFYGGLVGLYLVARYDPLLSSARPRQTQRGSAPEPES